MPIIGVPELMLLGPMLAVVAAVLLFLVRFGRRAKLFGYPSTSGYLRAAPRSDPEKRDAVDLVLKGLVLCVVAVMSPPFFLAEPRFYGGRKLLFGLMGLGLVDDGEQFGA